MYFDVGIRAATLGLAIYAKRHADVWDAAAALLREHCAYLSSHRIQSLFDNLQAAAAQMSAKDRARPCKGPPPVLFLVSMKPLEGSNALKLLDLTRLGAFHTSPIMSPKESNPFLYDAFSAKRKEKKQDGKEVINVVDWVCGEPGSVEVEISNPSPLHIRVS